MLNHFPFCQRPQPSILTRRHKLHRTLTIMHLRRIRAGSLDWQDAVDRACFSLFVMVIILVIYRHFWQGKEHCSCVHSWFTLFTSSKIELTCCVDSYDTNKCDALLTRGRWLEAPDPYRSVQEHSNWQPTGCMMHEYNAKDVTTCLKSRRVVFIGDSVTRQIFWAFAKKLDVPEHREDRHSNISVHAHGLTVEFAWDPYLNTSNLDREAAAASLSGSRNKHTDKAAILLIGGGLWHTRYLGEASYRRFESSISRITRALHYGRIPETPSGQPGHGSQGVDDLVVIAPIQVPCYDALSPERARSITPARVTPIYQHLQQSSIERNVTVAWSFSHMTWREPSAYDQDGLHVTGAVAAKMADVLLNARCNAVLRQSNSKGYPMDKTCCNTYQRPNRTQSVILIVSLGLLLALISITFKGEAPMSIDKAAS